MGVALWAQAIRSYCTGLSRWPVSTAILNANTWVFMGIFHLFYAFSFALPA